MKRHDYKKNKSAKKNTTGFQDPSTKKNARRATKAKSKPSTHREKKPLVWSKDYDNLVSVKPERKDSDTKKKSGKGKASRKANDYLTCHEKNSISRLLDYLNVTLSL